MVKTTKRNVDYKGPRDAPGCVLDGSSKKVGLKGLLLILQRDANRFRVSEEADQYSTAGLGQGHVTSWTYTRFAGDSSECTGYAWPGKLTLRALAPLYVIPISDPLVLENFDRRTSQFIPYVATETLDLFQLIQDT